MAKPKVRKVMSVYALKDLFLEGKVKDGEKVCFTVPKFTDGKRKRREFVRGTLFVSYKTYCECCGPEFRAEVVKSDGTVVKKWR